MDAGLIIVCIFLFVVGVTTILYLGGGDCCESPEEQEDGTLSPASTDSTVRVTSPIHWIYS